MQSFYIQNEKLPFILNPHTLKKLINIFQNHEMKVVNIEALCSGYILHKFESLDELLQYENPKNNEILAIDLFFISTNPDQEGSAKLNFIGGFGGSIVKMSIEASNNYILPLKKNIDDVLSGIRPRYHFLTPSRLALLIGFSLGILLVIVGQLWVYEFIKTLFNIEKSNKISEYIIQAVLSIIILIPISYFSAPVISYLFPRGVFAIGQGASRFEFQQKVLKWIIGIFTSILLAIFISLFS